VKERKGKELDIWRLTGRKEEGGASVSMSDRMNGQDTGRVTYDSSDSMNG
jgi:hypothetical protein